MRPSLSHLHTIFEGWKNVPEMLRGHHQHGHWPKIENFRSCFGRPEGHCHTFLKMKKIQHITFSFRF
jgi:hypothetical protein